MCHTETAPWEFCVCVGGGGLEQAEQGDRGGLHSTNPPAPQTKQGAQDRWAAGIPYLPWEQGEQGDLLWGAGGLGLVGELLGWDPISTFCGAGGAGGLGSVGVVLG